MTARGQHLNQGDKFAKRVEVQTPQSAVGEAVGIRHCPVRPLTRDKEAAVLGGITQDQRVDARDASFLQQCKTLSLEWMERMANLDPTQSVVG